MNRRRLLALCGAGVAGLAGCAGRGVDSPDGGDGTATPTTATPAGPSDPSLSAELEALQPAVVRLATADSLGVEAGGQYLFLRVSVEAGPPPVRTDLRFRFDGEEHEPSAAQGARDLYRLYGEAEGRYDADSGEGWVLFELPETGDPAGAGLVWGTGVWQPGPDLRRRLADPAPPLSVAWSPPETAPLGAEPTIGFAATNDGDTPGRVVAALNRSGGGIASAPVEAISRPVPPGGTVEWEVTDTFDVRDPGGDSTDDGEPDLTYRLRLPGEDRRGDVRIVSG